MADRNITLQAPQSVYSNVGVPILLTTSDPTKQVWLQSLTPNPVTPPNLKNPEKTDYNE